MRLEWLSSGFLEIESFEICSILAIQYCPVFLALASRLACIRPRPRFVPHTSVSSTFALASSHPVPSRVSIRRYRVGSAFAVVGHPGRFLPVRPARLLPVARERGTYLNYQRTVFRCVIFGPPAPLSTHPASFFRNLFSAAVRYCRSAGFRFPRASRPTSGRSNLAGCSRSGLPGCVRPKMSFERATAVRRAGISPRTMILVPEVSIHNPGQRFFAKKIRSFSRSLRHGFC